MSQRDSFAKDIEDALSPEVPLFAVVGSRGWNYDSIPEPPVREWSEVRSVLDYPYDDGFGSPDCHAVYVWSETMVAFVDDYDGATSVYTIPRNPQPVQPGMPGGS